MTKDTIKEKAKVHLEKSFIHYLSSDRASGEEASFFTGYRPLEEGIHFSLKPNEVAAIPCHDFYDQIDFRETPLCNCTGYLIRTITPAEEYAALLTRDYDNETCMDQLVFPGLTLSFNGDVEVSLSVVRPDLLFILLQRVAKYFI